MEQNTTSPAPLRTWQEVAKERGISLRVLGELVGRSYLTMQAYSAGKRVVPQEVMWRLARVLGEPVR